MVRRAHDSIFDTMETWLWQCDLYGNRSWARQLHVAELWTYSCIGRLVIIKFPLTWQKKSKLLQIEHIRRFSVMIMYLTHYVLIVRSCQRLLPCSPERRRQSCTINHRSSKSCKLKHNAVCRCGLHAHGNWVNLIRTKVQFDLIRPPGIISN